VKEFLSQRGHQFDERVVDEDDEAYDELLKRGYRTVPVTVVGSRIVRGYDPEALLTALADAG
jgi:glutaredoxin